MPHYQLFRWGVLAFAATSLLQAAEPEVSVADLPRIPATAPAQALSTFQTKPGFELQLVAAEPLVADPVAMDFDEEGRLFVVEMRDYSERRDERLGRIRILEDTDGDGRFDKSSVFVEKLPWPTAVVCYGGGVFVGSTPDIYFLKDVDGDRKADIQEVVFTGFATDSLKRLNVQALFNSFHWGLDNRIHGSASLSGGKITNPKNPGASPVELRGRDFSFDPRTLDLRPETGGGQHGMSFDNHGHKFLCSNSDHIQVALFDDHYLGKNPYAELPAPRESIALDGPAAEVFRRSPDEPWRVIRTRWRVTGAVEGLIEGGGRPSGYFTGATGVTIYRGNAFPEDYLGDAFVADCGSNLIHHKKVKRNGVSFVADRAPDEQKTEFIASTDNWFRPVQFANAPDGALYVADMYRETIEHPWSIPESIKRHLDLNSGNDRGRIYRIVPAGFKQPAAPNLKLSHASPSDWARILEHPNGWHRDTAARLLFQSQDRTVIPALMRQATTSPLPLGRMHSLWALDGLQGLDEATLATALRDPAATVREQAIRLLERSPSFVGASRIQLALSELARDPDPRVCYQLAWTLSVLDVTEEQKLLNALAIRSDSAPALVPAILNAVGPHSLSLLKEIIRNQPHTESASPMAAALSRQIGRKGEPREVSEVLDTLGGLEPSPLVAGLLVDLATGLEHPADQLLAGRHAPALRRHFRWALDAGGTHRPPGTSSATSAVALRLVGYLPFDESSEVILAGLSSQRSAAERQAALRALSAAPTVAAAQRVVSRWDSVAGSSRPELLSLLVRRKAALPLLLEGIEKGIIARSELSAAQVQSLRAEKDPAIQARVAALLGTAKAGQRQAVVNRYLPALARPGEAARGLKIYEQRCATCHRLQGKGKAVGPDLESVRSMGKEKLLTQILDPNREVAPNYQAYLIETTNGESLTGLLTAETAASLRLKTADGLETQLSRTQVKSVVPAGLSLMPEGLEEGITESDMADLLQLLSGPP